jgi:ATP synthase F1 gamma subunit
MNKSRRVHEQLGTVESIDSITHILESIASIRISQIKDEVLGSREFFQRLWAIFSQLRVSERDVARDTTATKNPKPAVLLVTANAGLTGEVDTNLINTALAEVDPKATDFFIYGMHGENLLLQRGIKPVKSFKFPEIGTPIDVNECVRAISTYEKPIVYYPSYSALTVQQISKLALIDAVQTIGSKQADLGSGQAIFKDNTIFEPSISEVVNYMERMMIGTILTEIILESNLAQYSSRFNAMTAASTRAGDMSKLLRRQYLKLKRNESDEANRRYSKHRKVAV